jgi:predicted metalloprotease with PDZ domain
MRDRARSIRHGALSAVLSAVLAAQAAAQEPVRYRVAFPAPEHHYAQVEVTFSGVPAGTLEARMSRSSPGRYAVHEFSKNVFDLRAFDGTGRELRPARPHPSQWDVVGHDGTVRIVYKVFGRHVDGTYLAVDDTHAHLNMPATLMWARGFDMRPARVTFVPPAASRWKPATQLFPTEDPWTFTAPNLQYLMDSPTELSDYTLRSFTVRNPDGREFAIHTAVHHDGDPSAVDEYASATEKIVNEAGAIFGEFPAFDNGSYTFLGDYVPWGGGDGMEHRNSTVVAAATSFRSPEAVRGVLDTVSHEFFHAWNVERIRPKSLEPFNFEDANISGELWLAEGFTQYYGPLIIARAGVRPGDPVRLVDSVVSVLNSPARQFRSPVEMSMHAPFTDAAVAIDQTNFSTTFISYYTYGAAIAVALDLSLRDRSNGKLSLDDYMRAMWRAHGKPGGPGPGLVARPYTLKDARDRLAEVSDDRRFADDFFGKYIEGREVPDYARLLARAGLVLRKRNAGAAWSGVLDRAGAGGRGRRRSAARDEGDPPGGLSIPGLVPWGTPAFAAGLTGGDVVTHADDEPVGSVADWQAAIGARKPGDRMPIQFTRRGTVFRRVITLVEDPTVEVVSVESTGNALSAAQQAFREAWLGTKRQ